MRNLSGITQAFIGALHNAQLEVLLSWPIHFRQYKVTNFEDAGSLLMSQVSFEGTEARRKIS